MPVMFYSGTLLKTIAWDTASQIALRICSKEVREEPEYIGSGSVACSVMSNSLQPHGL